MRLEVLAPAIVHWSADRWTTSCDTATVDTALGVHVCDLPVQDYVANTRIDFTFFWPEAHRWEQVDFAVILAER